MENFLKKEKKRFQTWVFIKGRLLFFWIDYEFPKLHRESVCEAMAFPKLQICDYKIKKEIIMNPIKKIVINRKTSDWLINELSWRTTSKTYSLFN